MVGVTLGSGCKGRDWAEDQPPSADSILPLADLELQAFVLRLIRPGE